MEKSTATNRGMVSDGRQGNRADSRGKKGTDRSVLVLRQVKNTIDLCACLTHIKGTSGMPVTQGQ